MTKFATGDFVVHPGQGVCRIFNVMERTVIAGATADEPGREEIVCVYQMSPVSNERVSICYPVDKEDTLHAIVSADEARALIEDAPNIKSDPFDEPQAWNVRDHFMGILHNGDCRDAMRIVKSMRERMELAQAQGKKPKTCYTRIFNDARQRLFDELSVAMGVSVEEVQALICARFGVEPLPLKRL